MPTRSLRRASTASPMRSAPISTNAIATSCDAAASTTLPPSSGRRGPETAGELSEAGARADRDRGRAGREHVVGTGRRDRRAVGVDQGDDRDGRVRVDRGLGEAVPAPLAPGLDLDPVDREAGDVLLDGGELLRDAGRAEEVGER